MNIICDCPREKVTQVGKINFKIRPPTALTANFVIFRFFTHWGAESILEPTISLKSATNVRLVAGGTSKSAMSLRERVCFTEKYAVKFTGVFQNLLAAVSYSHCYHRGLAHESSSSRAVQPSPLTPQPTFASFPTDLLFLRAMSSAEDIARMLSLGGVDSTALAEVISDYFSARPLTFHWYLSPIEHQA